MKDTAHRAAAIVGVSAILPDAPDAGRFWENIKSGRYSISDVDAGRWDPDLYFDSNPKAPDKTYSKIGGWVRDWDWKPFDWRLPIPPKVASAMDDAQRWGINLTRAVLDDFGYPDRPLNKERTAVIIGNAMAGEKHYLSALRIFFPEFARELGNTESFIELPGEVRGKIIAQTHEGMNRLIPEITEDTMPGELANILAGRIANVFNFRGPNFVCDAACASAMAAINAAVEGLTAHDFDAVVTGGIDRNMGASTFIKFSKIGALSATGTRPYADGADGFVMGEGASLFLMKRLADAERDGDRIYAVVRGVGGSSDGRGKGITAPNPIGQKLAVQRAWENAGVSPSTATLVEGHGTSTRVGDVVEVESLTEVFSNAGASPGTIALGSVKSNFGHLKGAAGSAGILKVVLALNDKVIPPSLHCETPNPAIDFDNSPFFVCGDLREWEKPECGVRRGAVSAFGFGGTNFHVVLEEHIPGRLNGGSRKYHAVPAAQDTNPPPLAVAASSFTSNTAVKPPHRGIALLGADSASELAGRLRTLKAEAEASKVLTGQAPLARDIGAPQRIAIDFGDPAELSKKIDIAAKALERNDSGFWRALGAQGIFRGQGDRQKIAFLFPGQGSQYVNMLAELRESEALVRETLDQADRVMEPILGKALSEFIYVDGQDAKKIEKANRSLMQTEITQPALIACDIALARLLHAYGIVPDMVMGHSLGEFGALVQARALNFGDALEAVAARGREMTRVSMGDNGKMAAVFAPLADVQRLLAKINGYAVIANINSYQQSVIGGESEAIEQAIELFTAEGVQAVPLPVSHAFHTRIVAPASQPLRKVLSRMHLRTPAIPTICNVTGGFYPKGEDTVNEMLDMLASQIASPVQFIKGLETLYEEGVRVFVEVGPKKSLKGLADNVLGEKADLVSLFTNHPKTGGLESFNHALCGLYAAGHGFGREEAAAIAVPETKTAAVPAAAHQPSATALNPVPASVPDMSQYGDIGKLFAEFIQRGNELLSGRPAASPGASEQIVISGAALGLPGGHRVFDDENVDRILHGEQFIDVIPHRYRQKMVEKHITRLFKPENGDPTFVTIDNTRDVIKLAGRAGKFDVATEFGINPERARAFDSTTAMAIAIGIDALRDAGIPLVLSYKTTTTGSQLPDRWRLPDDLRDDTGIIFASAFPGLDSFAQQSNEYYTEAGHREQLAGLESLRDWFSHQGNGQDAGSSAGIDELDRRIAELKSSISRTGYHFDRRFLFRVLSMGHSQFAEEIGARGPNTQINGACASTTHAVSLSEDWIRQGRCRRVIVISADNVTSDNMVDWIGAGFLASGAAATDERVEDAATPFDRRRHGMIMGMGAAGLVVESQSSVVERGLTPICEVLGTVAVNSAFHGTRLDIDHIAGVMEKLVSGVEQRHGIDRKQMAPRMLFMSHETYTPARGGSASAEIYALRSVFGEKADQIVITNTKGFTGHAMAAGIEDVVAVKALETGIVPPVPNFKEVDPELGALNLSTGGAYPVQYALRLGAGFGSQLGMSLTRWVPAPDGRRRNADQLGFKYRIADSEVWNGWLKQISGYEAADVEISTRRLRIKDQGPPRTEAAPAAEAAKTEIQAAAPPAPVTPVVAAITPAAATEHRAELSVPAVDGVEQQVIAVVAEKTDYPPDMLDLDLDLEADLGVDTVKQAEVFAEIRETYGIERDETMQMREFPTLAHVVQFVRDRVPNLPKVAPAVAVESAAIQPSPEPPPAPSAAGDGVEEAVVQLVARKTDYPPDMLDLDLDLEADLGVDTVKQAEVFAEIRETYGIERDETMQMREYPTLAHVVQFVRDRAPNLPTAAPAAAVEPAAASDPEISPPATEPAPATVVPSVIQAGDETIHAKVLEIVSGMTGYPSDMLDMELDLEADLGIDTVKQAEIFAALRDAYGIPRDENLQLKDFPTLNHAVGFVKDRLPAEASASPAVTGDEAIREKVLEVVSGMTGYPADMLDMELDLEADLGIDTVKQAEIFAALREAYGIARDDALQLKAFPTLNHAVGFVKDRMPQDAVSDTVAHAAMQVPPAEVAVEAAAISLDAADLVPRRVPVAFWRPTLDLFQETGVTLAEGTRVVLMPDQGGVAAALGKRLGNRGVEVLTIDPALEAAALEEQLKIWLDQGEIHGVYWLPALDPHATIADMSRDEWSEAKRVRVKSLYTTMRTLYKQIDKAGTFLVAATRQGGKHGYDQAGAQNPIGGGVSGFVKAYKREQADVLCKVIDFAESRKTAALAEVLIEEALRDFGAVELGRKNGQRWAIGLGELPCDGSETGIELNSGSVFLVTGAAGSIVSAVVADLAAASGGTFHLLDLTPEPDRGNPDIERFANDKTGLKRDIFERLKASKERATPAMVERELASIERASAALSAIEAVENAGGKAVWHAVNLLDDQAIAKVIGQLKEGPGKLDVLIHAGGLEISRFLADKPAEEFDLVFDVKCDGWHSLLSAIGDMPLGAAVVFSSVAGRFGNGGQIDYSAANDLLCKSISGFRSSLPETLGIAIDWTAWGGIGMATRGSIPTMMKAAGIDMLAPEHGIPTVRRELTRGPAAGEIVVGERLGILTEEFVSGGGLEVTAVDLAAGGPMLGEISGMGLYTGLTVETELDPSGQAFLYDHQIDGTPVLPGVMGLEGFAELATLLLPEWRLDSIEDVQFLEPFKFYRGEPRKLKLTAQLSSDGEQMVADCRLIGERQLKGKPEPVVSTAFTARVRLSQQQAEVMSGDKPAMAHGPTLAADDVYQVYFHGPAYRVLGSAWPDGPGKVIGQFAEDLPANHQPEDKTTQMAPRLIELCFQTAGMFELGIADRFGLPSRISSVKKLKEVSAGDMPFFSVVQPTEEGSGFDADIVNQEGEVFIRLVNYRTAELPGAASTLPTGPIKAIFQAG